MGRLYSRWKHHPHLKYRLAVGRSKQAVPRRSSCGGGEWRRRCEGVGRTTAALDWI